MKNCVIGVQVQTSRFISDIGVIDELFTEPWEDFEDDFVRLATVLLWCLLKVRLCSPLQLVTLLVGASLDYPNSFV